MSDVLGPGNTWDPSYTDPSLVDPILTFPNSGSDYYDPSGTTAVPHTQTYPGPTHVAPPIGVVPEDVIILQRIQDLANAISRQFEVPGYKPDVSLISKWSDEMNRLSDRLNWISECEDPAF